MFTLVSAVQKSVFLVLTIWFEDLDLLELEVSMSSYTSKGFKQDMPPPGGYEEINYRRIPIQRILGCKNDSVENLNVF